MHKCNSMLNTLSSIANQTASLITFSYAILFIMLYEMPLTSVSVDEKLKWNNENERMKVIQ